MDKDCHWERLAGWGGGLQRSQGVPTLENSALPWSFDKDFFNFLSKPSPRWCSRSSNAQSLFSAPLFPFLLVVSFAYGGSLEPRRHGLWKVQCHLRFLFHIMDPQWIFLLTLTLVIMQINNSWLFFSLQQHFVSSLSYPHEYILFCKLCLFSLSLNKRFLIRVPTVARWLRT